MLVGELEKTVCRCHNWLLSPGPHYAPGEEEEEDGLKYETDAPSRDSYMTPPSTGGCSKPSHCPSSSPTLEDSNPETSAVLRTAELKAHIKSFLEEVEKDMDLDDLPLLKNVTLLPVLAPIVPGFIPFAVSTSQRCVPPKSGLAAIQPPLLSQWKTPTTPTFLLHLLFPQASPSAPSPTFSPLCLLQRALTQLTSSALPTVNPHLLSPPPLPSPILHPQQPFLLSVSCRESFLH